MMATGRVWDILLAAILPVIHGMHLRMAAETWDPFFMISEDNEGVLYSGVMEKAASIYDVRKMFGFFYPLPLSNSEWHGDWLSLVKMPTSSF